MATKKFDDAFIQKMAEYCAEHPEWTYTEVGEKFKLDRETVSKLVRNDPRFHTFYHEINKRLFEDMESLVRQKFWERVMNGDRQCILYALDNYGYKASEKVEVSSNDITVNIGG